MELQHINVKVLVDGQLTIDLDRVIELFHGWVSEQSCDELLIDIADYRHVPHGPGIVLVGHQADYALDNTRGRYGLLYNRKAPLDGSNDDRLLQAMRAAARACQKLEAAFPELKFSRQTFDLFINDRALAPNTPETLSSCQPLIEAFLNKVLGDGGYEIEHHAEPRSRFGFTVTANAPFDLAALAG